MSDEDDEAARNKAQQEAVVEAEKARLKAEKEAEKARLKAEKEAAKTAAFGKPVTAVCIEQCQHNGVIINPGDKKYFFPNGIPESKKEFFEPA